MVMKKIEVEMQIVALKSDYEKKRNEVNLRKDEVTRAFYEAQREYGLAMVNFAKELRELKEAFLVEKERLYSLDTDEADGYRYWKARAMKAERELGKGERAVNCEL